MLPILLVLLFGAGLVAGLVLALGALLRHLRRSSAPAPVRAVTGVFGLMGLGLASLAGGVAFVALLAMTTATALLEHGPVRSIQVLRLDGAALAADRSDLGLGLEGEALEAYQRDTDGLDPRYPVHVLVEYRGEVRLDRLHRWLDKESDGHVRLVGVEPAPGGLTRLDFGLALDPAEVVRFETEFEQAQPFLDLPHGLRLEVREPGE